MSIYKTEPLWPPISKRHDPGTSKIAEAKQNKGPRAKRMRQVLELVGSRPGLTSAEYGMLFRTEHPELPDIVALDTPRKRLSDLRQLDLVERVEQKVCPHTGNLGWTYKPSMAGLRHLRADAQSYR